MLEIRAPLHVFERCTVTGVRYRDEVLQPYVRIFMGSYGPEFFLMDDNAKPHRALLVDEFLKNNVCNALGREIATRNPPPRTIQEMKAVSRNEWDQLPQER
ncbi:transposable element Tc1 transposase [Trichonephila clavipes]|nr:transposable element Tc1 transposase [Trichonephila clavipes]